MEIIYNVGPVSILKESGMTFTVFNITLNKPDITIIGGYLNKDYRFTRIAKDSTYGKKILALLCPRLEQFSRNEVKLKALISTLSDGMDMNKNISRRKNLTT
jgi:hypothetical protein